MDRDDPDGGPAFPRPVGQADDTDHGTEWNVSHEGMSLLDYFAGQALAGLCARLTSDNPDAYIAKRAYLLAAAMLKEAEKGR
tara:strand:- start:249 stop:494 length:246 start_codon:yes stop_codon:yes gene_type:complete